MKTSANLKALLGDIKAEVAEKRAAEEASRAAERKERVDVVMELLPLTTASPKAAAAVREQMYSVPEAKAKVRGYIRNEFLGFSGPLLPHAAAQIAAAVGELSEISAEKLTEIREKNKTIYEHKKIAHEGKWQNGCPECATVFVQESKADGTTHRYIAMTHWAGMLLKERYDQNRPKLMPKGQVGPIGKALIKAEGGGEGDGLGEDSLGNRTDKGGKGSKSRTTERPEPKPKGRKVAKPHGGGGNDEGSRAMRDEIPQA